MQHYKKEWGYYHLRQIMDISQEHRYHYIKQKRRVAQLNKEWRC